MSTTADDFPIIALVCSRGGLAALARVLRQLPADLPAAVIVLQHLKPDATSVLPQLLASNCRLSIDTAADGHRLSRGRVLVAPPGYHTVLDRDGVVQLIASGPIPPARPSADLLLTTLATAMRHRAIAVVLTGGGHDGATGATAIHRNGGVVIAADPETSEDGSMPAATISRDMVTDHVTGLDEIGQLLVELVTGADPDGPG